MEIFRDTLLSRELAFRGGTALHKLFLPTPARYSEDIDLAQISPGPIGPVMTALRKLLDPFALTGWKSCSAQNSAPCSNARRAAISSIWELLCRMNLWMPPWSSPVFRNTSRTEGELCHERSLKKISSRNSLRRSSLRICL